MALIRFVHENTLYTLVLEDITQDCPPDLYCQPYFCCESDIGVFIDELGDEPISTSWTLDPAPDGFPSGSFEGSVKVEDGKVLIEGASQIFVLDDEKTSKWSENPQSYLEYNGNKIFVCITDLCPCSSTGIPRIQLKGDDLVWSEIAEAAKIAYLNGFRFQWTSCEEEKNICVTMNFDQFNDIIEGTDETGTNPDNLGSDILTNGISRCCREIED